MPEFPDEFIEGAEFILKSSLTQGVIPRETTGYQQSFTSPVVYTPIDLNLDLERKRPKFFPNPREEDSSEWLMELYGCIAIAFSKTYSYLDNLRSMSYLRDYKILDVEQTTKLLQGYARHPVWTYHVTEPLRTESTDFNNLIEQIAHLNSGGLSKGSTFPALEEEFVRSMHLSPLTGKTPKGKFIQVLESLSPGRVDKSVPQFIEQTRKNTERLLLGKIKATGKGQGYVGKSLTQRLLDIQSELLDGIPYEKGLRLEPIRVGEKRLEVNGVENTLEVLERCSTDYFKKSWKTNLNYMLAYIWSGLIEGQTLSQANKRSGFFAVLSYALEYGDTDLVDQAFIPRTFLGHDKIRESILSLINAKEKEVSREQITSLAKSITESPKLTIQQYANLMLGKGYSYGN